MLNLESHFQNGGHSIEPQQRACCSAGELPIEPVDEDDTVPDYDEELTERDIVKTPGLNALHWMRVVDSN